jgi:hypothetical protein
VEVRAPYLREDYCGCPHCGDKKGYFICNTCGNLSCQGKSSPPNFSFCPECKMWTELEVRDFTVRGAPRREGLASHRPDAGITCELSAQQALPESNSKPQLSKGRNSGSVEGGKPPSLPPSRR